MIYNLINEVLSAPHVLWGRCLIRSRPLFIARPFQRLNMGFASHTEVEDDSQVLIFTEISDVIVTEG